MVEERSYADMHSRCCDVPLVDCAEDYRYRAHNPDTRWFQCPECGAHWGRHRMKGTWKVDPYDYTNNPKVRAALGLED
jgi:hypothetical protein